MAVGRKPGYLHVRFGILVTAVLIVVLLAVLAARGAQAQQMVPLVGNRPASLGGLGTNAAPSLSLSIEVRLSLRNQAQLNQFLSDLQNPSSPNYREFLTPDEFTARFGPSPADLNAVVDWLTQQGFHVTAASLKDRVVTATGNMGVAAHAFGTNFVTDGGSLYANTSDPMVPAALAPSISYIGGLDNLHGFLPGGIHSPVKALPAPSPHSRVASFRLADFIASGLPGGLQPNFAGPMGNAFGPQDLYKFYNQTPLSQAGNTGTGAPDCIALPEFSDVLDAAVTQFTTTFSLPAVSLTRNGGPSPGITESEDEALVDIEWSHAVSPSTPVRLYFGNTGADALTSSIQNAVTDNVCGVISSSISECFTGPEPSYFQALDTIFMQAVAQGQSVMVASGDSGAAGSVFDTTKNECVAGTTANVNEEAASPNVTAVGGTQFPALYDAQGNDTSVQGVGVDGTEVAWNNPEDAISSGDSNFGSTGGGESSVFAKPAYQTGQGVPNDGKRDIPDVALGASLNLPGFYVSNDVSGTPTLEIFGGTSISVQIWAGLTRLIGKMVGGNPPGRLGNINLRIYQMANANYAASGLFDVVSGNNTFNGVTGFNAGPGFDLTTGWGSPNFAVFAAAFVATPTPTGTASQTPTPTPTSATATATATPTTAPTPTATGSMVPPTPTPMQTPTVGGSVTVPSMVNVFGGLGQTVSAGGFVLHNSTSGAESVGSVTVSVSAPGLYSSLALTATVGASSQTVTVSPPSSSTAFNFSPALSVPGGGSASFSLSVTITTTQARFEHRTVAYAAMLGGLDGGGSGLGSLEVGLALLGLGLMMALPPARRRTVMLLALLIMLSANQIGCGGGSGIPIQPMPVSTQAVVAVSATGPSGGPVTFTGLPASLGRVSSD
jgi:subtilase family serine protease